MRLSVRFMSSRVSGKIPCMTSLKHFSLTYDLLMEQSLFCVQALLSPHPFQLDSFLSFSSTGSSLTFLELSAHPGIASRYLCGPSPVAQSLSHAFPWHNGHLIDAHPSMEPSCDPPKLPLRAGPAKDLPHAHPAQRSGKGEAE